MLWNKTNKGRGIGIGRPRERVVIYIIDYYLYNRLYIVYIIGD